MARPEGAREGHARPGDEAELAERIERAAREEELAAGTSAPTRAGRAVDRIAEALAVLLLGTIVVLVLGNALGRYLFAKPLVWTEEIVASLIIWLAVAGAFLALRRRQLITVGAVSARLPAPARAALGLAAELVSAFVLGYLAWLGWRYLGLFGADTTPFFGFPKGFYMLAIPVGLGAMAIACLVSALGTRGWRP